MNRKLFNRLVVILGVLLPIVLPAAATATAPETTSAIIVGTNMADILACPKTSCEIRERAPLGAEVAVTGESSDGFVPVRYGETAGFASVLYLAVDPSDPPYLVAGAPGCQRVAFIFNIGIGYEPDAGILDTLAAEEVPATMFVMGWWADQDPPILRRMVDDGYPIGSHGYEAIELTSRSDDEVFDDIAHAATAIEEATGQPPAPYFTPYAAAIDDRVRAIVAAQGLLPVGFEVPAADYGPEATEESVYTRVMSEMHDGAIVEFHLDAEVSAQSTGRALPRIIDDLRALGYQFVPIPEMAQPC